MKKEVTLIFLLASALIKAQLAVYDPQNTMVVANQATQISQAIEILKQTKASVAQAKQSVEQLNYIRQYMENAADNLQKVGNIKDLKINQIENILDRILCLKGGARYYQSIKFLNIVNMIRGAYGKCDNNSLFKITWGGVTKSINEEIGSSQKNLNGFVKQYTTQQDIVNKTKQVDAYIEQAYTVQQAGSNYSEETKLELANKYKEISDELMKLSHELSGALNQEGSNVIEVTKGERLALMSKAMDYQLKSIEYEEKYAQLLKEATELSDNDRKEIANYKRALAIREFAMFKY